MDQNVTGLEGTGGAKASVGLLHRCGPFRALSHLLGDRITSCSRSWASQGWRRKAFLYGCACAQ